MNFLKGFKTIIISFIIFSGVSCDKNEEDSILDISVILKGESFTLPFVEGEAIQTAKETKYNIEIIAHRGASSYEPENSLLSFKKAFDLNSDAIELDLWISKDDSIMVFHDRDTKLITGESYDIPNTNANILRTLNIGKGEKMPFLNEVFQTLPAGKKIYLDIKWNAHHNSKVNPKSITNLLNIIEKHNRLNDTRLTCFDADYLNKVKERKPELECYWITSDSNSNNQIFSVLERYNFNGVVARYSQLNAELNSYLKLNNKNLYVYVLYSSSDAIFYYKNFNLKGIYTGKPDLIRKGFEEYFN
ncbi:MAG: glycerophosphodiester phosphodiesterase [Flavobacteriaceae bacterium]|nr:glycerophosphodiester phosphodiesterase [Flavobacteriaceae bacterium]